MEIEINYRFRIVDEADLRHMYSLYCNSEYAEVNHACETLTVARA